MGGEQINLPNEYPLPVVGGRAASKVIGSTAVNIDEAGDDSSSIIEFDLEPAFGHLMRHNRTLGQGIALWLTVEGYTAVECTEAAKLGAAVTHFLLFAQAQFDLGLPDVDLDAEEYPLPVVEVDTLRAYRRRVEAGGLASATDELTGRNGWIPQVFGILGIPIGMVRPESRSTQAGELAAVLVHGMLQEQATIDAFNRQWAIPR